VTINVESAILRRCGHGEWRVQETFLSATENFGEMSLQGTIGTMFPTGEGNYGI